MSKEYRRKKKLFNKELKRIHKEHTPDKCDKIKHYNWRKEWGPFIRYQGDWDGFYLLELIIYKLERMYADLDIFSDEVREDLNKRLLVLQETIDLGKKIQTYDYHVEEQQWRDVHCAHVINIYKKGYFFKEEPIHKLIKYKSKENDTDSYNPLDDFSGEKAVKEWAEKNGYKREDLSISYSGEWDNQENYKIWKKLIKKCNKAEQDDTDKFFKLISRNYRGWWW